MIEILDDEADNSNQQEFTSLKTSISAHSSGQTSKVLIEDITVSVKEDSAPSSEKLAEESDQDVVIERPSNKESEDLLKSLSNVPIKETLTVTSFNEPSPQEDDEDSDRPVDSDLEDLD